MEETMDKVFNKEENYDPGVNLEDGEDTLEYQNNNVSVDTDDNLTCNDCVRIYNDLSTGGPNADAPPCEGKKHKKDPHPPPSTKVDNGNKWACRKKGQRFCDECFKSRKCPKCGAAPI